MLKPYYVKSHYVKFIVVNYKEHVDELKYVLSNC